MDDKPNLHRATLAAQGLRPVDPVSGAVGAPLMPATTYARDEDFRLIGDIEYSRDANLTYREPEALIARLEEGADAMVFASGMAAAAAVLQALRPGDHVVTLQVMYFELRRWMTRFCEDWGLTIDFFDPAEPDTLHQALKPGKTKLVWIESPTNPTWSVVDIAAIAKAAHDAGALLAVDSTVATPVLTRPLCLGADLVVYSATKFLNGHGDVVGGAAVTRTVDDFWERVGDNRRSVGAILGPFEAWLLMRGLRTVFLRVQRASDNALAIARHLDGHPKLTAVLYPGLEGHPGHAIAARQMPGGFGGMLSLRVKGGADAALRVVGACNVWLRATSLGSVESLISHRASIEPQSPIPKDLLRLSVGIEHVDDLIADLDQALERA